MALCNDGLIKSFGLVAGNGSSENSSSPVTVNNIKDAVAVASGNDHRLAVSKDGSVWSWGMVKNGRLGNGASKDCNSPVKISSLTDVIVVAAGSLHSVVLKKDGTVWTFGGNGKGELGIDSKKDQQVPVKVETMVIVSLLY